MPIKSGGMTPSEKKFSEVFAATGSQKFAGQEAGYKSSAGASMAMARPAVQAEIVRVQTERLFKELLPLAVEAHIALLRDARTPAGARVKAVRRVYDRTVGGDDKGAGKEAHEMSADELANALEKLKREASDRSKPVIEHEPNPGVFD